MRLFSTSGAQHYCSNYSSITGLAEGSIDAFYLNHFESIRRGIGRTLNEGTPIFDEYRACSLRDVERNLFLAASQYRRFLDLLLASSSNWSFVTIYYGNWYAANALLGLFGFRVFKKHFCEVRASNPGSQQLSITRIERPTHTAFTGPHQTFWDFFYKAVATLSPSVPTHLSFALSPISGQPEWQIEERKKFNYDSYLALDLTHRFENNFDKSNFPASLPGSLNTQYSLFEAMLEITFSFAKQFQISTDCLALITATPLKVAIKRMIYTERAPNLVAKTKKHELFKK